MSDEPRRIFRLPSARDSVEREVEDEIRFHIEPRAQELERGGMTPAAAQEEARREFGDAAAACAELPGGLQFASRTEIWTPLAFTPSELQQRGTLNMLSQARSALA